MTLPLEWRNRETTQAPSNTTTHGNATAATVQVIAARPSPRPTL